MRLLKRLACLSALVLILILPVSVSAETIPAMPDGGTALVKPGWLFNYDDTDVFSIKNDKVMVALMGYNAYGEFDLSYYDLNDEDTYVVAADITINEKYDTYSGPRINFRGAEGKAYQVAIQADCVYILDVDLRTGWYTCIYSDTSFVYELNTTYRVEIVSSATNFSLVIDGKPIYENGVLPEARSPMFGIGNGICVCNVANYTMYNASSAETPVTVKPLSDATNPAPTTTTTAVAATTTTLADASAVTEPTNTAGDISDTDGGSAWIIVLVICVVLVVIGVVVAVILLRRNKTGKTKGLQ